MREIQVRDGVDIAFKPWPPPRGETVPQTFVFAPADVDRTADLAVFVGSVNDGRPRPNAIRIIVGSAHSEATIETASAGLFKPAFLIDFAPVCYLVGLAAGKPSGHTSSHTETLLVNELDSKDGREWDTFRTPVDIRAGASEITVELISYDDGSGNLPASLTWVTAVFDVAEVAPPPGEVEAGWMTGGGSVFTANGDRVTHGFRVNCDVSRQPNRLQVNWGKGEKFHLEQMTSAACTDDPALDPENPEAGFDTHDGEGNGLYNGEPGATVEWTFTDDGEPGTSDRARIVVRDVLGMVVLSVDGDLNKGNHQAHSGGQGGAKTAGATASTPEGYRLFANTPNPFNPSTQISYEIPESGPVSLEVYSELGQLVRVLAKGHRAAGRHSVAWDGESDDGAGVSAGVYFYRLESAGVVETRRMLLLK